MMGTARAEFDDARATLRSRGRACGTAVRLCMMNGATNSECTLPLKGIGAKIAWAYVETCAFAAVRAGDVALRGDFGAGFSGWAERRSLRSAKQRSDGWRATAGDAPRSRGRDAKRLCEGSGEQRDEEVSENPRLDDPWVFRGRRAQSDQALQALERELNAPAHAIELENGVGGELVLGERCHVDDEAGGDE